MPKNDYTQEFLNALKEELKKEKQPKHPHIERIMERMKNSPVKMPPSEILFRSIRFNRRKREALESETWASLVREIYDFWVEENYPE